MKDLPLIRVVGLLLLTAATACERPQNGSGSGNEPDPAGQSSAETQTQDPPCSPPSVDGVGAVEVAGGHTFRKPTFATQAPGDDEALYVVERAGRIRVVVDGQVRQQPFLDIRDRVGTEHTERGLLGIAFHPNYADNGRFFLYYTPSAAHKNVVAEYRRADDKSRRASGEEVRRLVEVTDPEDNHNGGMLAFGPDGHLFVGMGDGGGAGDRHGDIGNGQNRETLLGSILRLEVDRGDDDVIPEDNPFVDGPGRDEIWAWGLRNPWRFSFDRKTGDLYIGDVGQNEIEEIDFQAAGSEGGNNYGWRAYEGRSVFDESLTDRVEEHVPPIVQFHHGADDAPVRNGCSITGGYVYRGEAHEGLRGAYIYGDFCSRDVAAFRYCDGEVVGHQRVPGLSGLSSGLGSFGQGNNGELYLVYHGSGKIKRLVAE
ncbi:MAG: sorbosone dehydrogenase family protein [Bradymonadaceae bacterium]